MQAKIKIVRILAFALPAVSILAATHALAATSEERADNQNKPLIVGKLAVREPKHQEPPVVALSTVECALPAKEVATQTKIVAGTRERRSAPSDIRMADTGSSNDQRVDPSVSEDGSNQYLAKDKLELSLETPSLKADAPQSCKSE